MIVLLFLAWGSSLRQSRNHLRATSIYVPFSSFLIYLLNLPRGLFQLSSLNSTESTNSELDVSGSQLSKRITVTCEDRWQVYHRLQMLDIDCQCGGFQPLKVTIQTPTEAIQLWSVVRCVSEPRARLVQSLNSCWNVNASN